MTELKQSDKTFERTVVLINRVVQEAQTVVQGVITLFMIKVREINRSI